MARRDQPYLPFFVKDYLSDEKLKECRAESHGVYINVMCLMHTSHVYGTILLKQKYKQNGKQILNFAYQLAKQLPFSLEEIERSLTELVAEDVLQIDDEKLSQKRMVKDGMLSDIRASAGSKGGKSKEKSGSFAKAKLQAKVQAKPQAKVQANSEIEIENEYATNNENVNRNNKVEYAEFVSMTEGEFDNLANRVGLNGAKKCIEILDNYKGANGKKYKSDYRAILNWVIGRYEEEKKASAQSASSNPYIDMEVD